MTEAKEQELIKVVNQLAICVDFLLGQAGLEWSEDCKRPVSKAKLDELRKNPYDERSPE